MPRLFFQDGITNLTYISGRTRVGIMLAIIVLSLTEKGELFFNKCLPEPGVANKMRYIFQIILCYWSWLKKDFLGRGLTLKQEKMQ